MSAEAEKKGGGAGSVGLGILTSRLFGFLRERALAHYFGVGPHIDAFRAALRTPNILQNLLGEGTLSAAFIPIYSRLIHAGRDEEAGRFAGAIFGLLLAVAAATSLLGMALAHPLVVVLAPGFVGDAAAVQAGTLAVDRFALTVTAVRILFPMTGFLVLSVWALGILNSHRRFLLPYLAPAVWNAATIAALLWVGAPPPKTAELTPAAVAALDRLILVACWGTFLGGLLQFLVQLPAVARVLKGFRLSFSPRVPGVGEALRAFGPVVAGRGVVQLASYLDLFLASLLAPGAVSVLSYAQMFYMLPISLFAMSVAAAELPVLSRLGADAEGRATLLPRVRRSLAQMAFLNVPTLVGYLAFGFLLVGALYRTGRFHVEDNWLVYLTLCGYATGLLATTSSRLLQNTFYALGDTRTPARIATLRMAVSAAASVPLMLALDRLSLRSWVELPAGAFDLRLGAAGLALASGVGAWLELGLLRRALGRQLEGALLPIGEIGRMLGLAGIAAVPAGILWWLLPVLPVAITAALVVGAFAAIYLLLAWRAGMPQLSGITRRFRR